MGSKLTIGVVGATGAVGKDILDVLDKVKWRPRGLVALASAASVTPFVQYGDESVSVDDAAAMDAGDLDGLILAAPREASRAAGERALEAGIPIVDLSGAFQADGDVPVCVPWVNPEVLQDLGPRSIVAVPGAPAVLLASVLGPLHRSGVLGDAHATMMMPASSWGKAGIDELSRQVVTLFNAGAPPRRVFPQGLAFDLVPALGALQEDGWTDLEAATAAEIATLVGGGACSCSLVATPVFSGMSADVTVRLQRRILPELALRILQDGGVRVAEEAGMRHIPRPRRVEGQPFVHVARVRTSEDGTTLHLWVVMDNLRTVASAGVSLLGAALRATIRAEAGGP